MAVPLSQPPQICQGYFCHSCPRASVKGCHGSRGASSKGCCYMAPCPEPVRPPGCAHHLSLSALSPGSYRRLMVHWVSPNNLLTSMSAAGGMAGHLRAHMPMNTPTCKRSLVHSTNCSHQQDDKGEKREKKQLFLERGVV